MQQVAAAHPDARTIHVGHERASVLDEDGFIFARAVGLTGYGSMLCTAIFGGLVTRQYLFICPSHVDVRPPRPHSVAVLTSSQLRHSYL